MTRKLPLILSLASLCWLIAMALIVASVRWPDFAIAVASVGIFAGLVWIATMGGRTRR